MPITKQQTYYEVRYKRRIYDEDCDHAFEMNELYDKLKKDEINDFLKRQLVPFKHNTGHVSYFDPLNDFKYVKVVVKTKVTTVRRKFNIPIKYYK